MNQNKPDMIDAARIMREGTEAVSRAIGFYRDLVKYIEKPDSDLSVARRMAERCKKFFDATEKYI